MYNVIHTYNKGGILCTFFEKLSKLVGNEINFVNKEISVKGKVFRVEENKDSFYVYISDYECSFLCQTQDKIKKRRMVSLRRYFRI